MTDAAKDLKSRCRQLLTILRDLSAGYTALLRLMEKEKQALIRSEPAAVAQMMTEKQERIRRLNEIEARRLDVMDGISRRLGLPVDELSLSRLAPLLPDPFPDKLPAEGDRLMNILKEVREAGRVNAVLINQSLHLVRSSMETISRLQERLDAAHQVYSRNGRVTDIATGGGEKRRTLSGKA
ncbi:MAG: hypothetical protein CSB33_02545 [Desulfobacterales bacterium]|nr:MAG: hypothetical protein CSB33_02545 [Desulfobacterales bacterium]